MIPSPADAAASLVYLGRSRLQRSRANLLQTLNTVEAFENRGIPVELWLPAWPRGLDLRVKLREAGIAHELRIRPSRWLHPRWHFWPFVRLKRRFLSQARVLYTRVPEISLALGRCGLVHNLEIHHVEDLLSRRLGDRVIALHRQGVLDWLIPISHGAKRRLLAAGAVAARVHVGPSGVKLEAYADLPAFDPGRLARPRIVHLGRLSPERGAAVFRALAAEPWCEVTIVGGGDEVIAGAGNVGIVPLTEVPDWYARSDLTLLPYQPEIGTVATMSPLKLFEALAAGRPIIASDLPTIREVLVHEESALLLPPADTGAWLQAVRRLHADQALAGRLAANAKALAPQYSWSARAAGIAAALKLSGDQG